MNNIKNWSLLNNKDKKYWINIYSKLNKNDFIPKEYMRPLKGIKNLIDHQIKTGKTLFENGNGITKDFF